MVPTGSSRIPRANHPTRSSPPPIHGGGGGGGGAFTSNQSFSFSFSDPSLPPPRNRRLVPSTSSHLNNDYNRSSDQMDELRRQSNLSTLGLSPRRLGMAASGSTTTARGTGGAGGMLFGKQKGRRSSALSPGFEDNDTWQSSGYGAAGQGAEELDEEEEWGQVDRMRNWRNDAMTQHLYSTAEFWGGKIFGMTGNPNDAFWLAQTLFYTHQYSQACLILTSLRQPHSSDGSPHPSTSTAAPRRLTDTSLACRYLAAQCQVRLGQWEEALDMVGRGNGNILPFNGMNGSGNEVEDATEAGDGGIKLTASTAHLRGLIHLYLGATELAKESFIEALTRDVKCFESFQALVGGEMMGNEEEWEFIRGLPFLAQTGDDAQFVKMMYTVRLKKISHHAEMLEARRTLTVQYGLGEDPDVMFGLADEMYAGMRFAECYKLTSRILAVHSSHRPTLPLHLSCLHHLPHLRSRLFLLAHQLVDIEPDDAISWYAVGMWYFSSRKWEESRRYFGKSVLIDPRFGPSWVAFAHSYAYEGEHDQAITAYSTALRHFQGTHLPLLFIGMQHLGLSNTGLALEYLEAANLGCSEDPLVKNELGVVALMDGKYELAIEYFVSALQLVKRVQSSPAAWTTTHLNLGHAYRKLKLYTEAHACFRRVISLDSRSAPAYSALGLVEHYMGHYQESIARYHEALSISPGDPVTCDLLKLVLEDTDHQISIGNIPFPGLPTSVLLTIDEQVALLDAEITNPTSNNMEEQRGDASEMSGLSRTEDEDLILDESGEGETMDMSG